MSKVKFRFRLHQSASSTDAGEGVVKIVDNCIWVSPEVAQSLVDANLGKIEEGEEPKSTDTAANAEADAGKEMIKSLLKKTVDELQALAVEFELPSEEWRELTKPNLVKYLIEKAFNKPE